MELRTAVTHGVAGEESSHHLPFWESLSSPHVTRSPLDPYTFKVCLTRTLLLARKS
jgi:hypothetical protein